MGKGDVSIPYVIGWILGIMVLATAVYLIYRHITKSPLSCSQCSAEVTAWCAKCYKIYGNTDWGGGSPMDDKLKECISRCELGSAPGSCNSTAFNFCKAYIPF